MANRDFGHLSKELDKVFSAHAVHFRWDTPDAGGEDGLLTTLMSNYSITGETVSATISNFNVQHLNVSPEIKNANNIIFFYTGEVDGNDMRIWASREIQVRSRRRSPTRRSTNLNRTVDASVTWKDVAQKFLLGGKNVFLILRPSHKGTAAAQMAEDFRQEGIRTIELLNISPYTFQDVTVDLARLDVPRTHLRDLRGSMNLPGGSYTISSQNANPQPMRIYRRIGSYNNHRIEWIPYRGPVGGLSRSIPKWATSAPTEVGGIEVADINGRIKVVIKCKRGFNDANETLEYTRWIWGLYHIIMNTMIEESIGA